MVAWKAYQLSLIIAAVAQWAMNVALTANPIGIIIVAIGALVAAVIWMIMNWKTVVAWLKIGWDWLVKTFDAVKGLSIIFGGLIFPIVIIIELVRNLIQYWSYITEAFKAEGILGGLIAIGKVILTSILAPIESLFNLLAKLPGVGSFFKGLGEGIGNFREGLIKEGQAPINQADRMSYSKNETINKGEVTIKDTTGKAESKNIPKGNNYNIKLVKSGAF